jgi:hypothetical protein
MPPLAPAFFATYDPDGNVLTDGTVTWTYDLNNRTTSSKIGTTTGVGLSVGVE